MPAEEERASILRALSREMQLGAELQTDAALRKVAERCEGYTGADLQAVLYNAQLEAIHEALGEARPGPARVTGEVARETAADETTPRRAAPPTPESFVDAQPPTPAGGAESAGRFREGSGKVQHTWGAESPAGAVAGVLAEAARGGLAAQLLRRPPASPDDDEPAWLREAADTIRTPSNPMQRPPRSLFSPSARGSAQGTLGSGAAAPSPGVTPPPPLTPPPSARPRGGAPLALDEGEGECQGEGQGEGIGDGVTHPANAMPRGGASSRGGASAGDYSEMSPDRTSHIAHETLFCPSYASAPLHPRVLLGRRGGRGARA